MDKRQLKKLLKPLINECIKEALLEGGILSGIISEVALGLTRAPILTESPHQKRIVDDDAAYEERMVQKRAQVEAGRLERVQQLNESFAGKFNGVNPFEGSAPTSLNEGTTHTAPGSLDGMDPNDPGVDISGLQALVGGQWNRQLGKKR